MTPTNDYQPIEHYGAVGNLRTVALVCRSGSVDWLCLPHLDCPSVFGALLDNRRGGRFLVRAHHIQHIRQNYLVHTNVLETSFDTDGGRLVVTDFMPLHGSIEGCGESRTEPALYRLLRADGGDVQVDVEWSPRFDYGHGRTRIESTEEGLVAVSGRDELLLAGLAVELDEDEFGPVARARFVLRAGEERALVTSWGSTRVDVRSESVRSRLEETAAVWRAWVRKEEATGDRSWAGPYREQVFRSELALRLLAHADTGAIAAAATTSLPEEIGGVRNWDYRFTWIRDAALTAQAFFALGHEADARSFVQWAQRISQEKGEKSWGLQLLYGLHGESELDEKEISDLEGYRGSSPVRVGNAAADQLQLDIYGELISAAYEFVRSGAELHPAVAAFLPHVADQACEAWHKPDYGIWEVRNGPFHFVYSKAMVWMALDRAMRLAGRGVIEGDVSRWALSRHQVREEILERGFDAELGAFKQAYERDVLDASNLLIPLLELLRFDDPRVQSTVDQTLEELTEEGLVYRYKADDGLPGTEGAFLLCTFWLVDVLALSNRLDEAYALYEGVLGRANHLGLYSEQIDPATGVFLGNFPQAYSHVALINSTLYLAYMEGRETPVPAPIGSEEHRAEGDPSFVGTVS